MHPSADFDTSSLKSYTVSTSRYVILVVLVMKVLSIFSVFFVIKIKVNFQHKFGCSKIQLDFTMVCKSYSILLWTSNVSLFYINVALPSQT